MLRFLGVCVTVVVLTSPICAQVGGEDIIITMRGDSNHDGAVNVSDASYLSNYLYSGGPEPACMNEADVNSDSAINIFDITHIIGYLYMEGPPPDCP